MPTITNPTQPNAASIANANLPGMASAPVSTTPVVPAPTVADLYGTGSSLDAKAAAADAAKTAANSPAALAGNEASSRSDVLGQYQSQLDALDQAAATARANITSSLAPAAASRVGGAGSLAASRGLAGSSFGNAMIDNANTQNASDLNTAISTSNDKYATQKSSLLQFIQGEADKEATARQTASTQGADAKITEIQNRTTRAQTSAQSSVQAMIANGVTDSTNPNYQTGINAIASSTGLTKDQVTAMYTTAQTTAATTAAKNAQDAATLAGTTATTAKTTAETGAVLTPAQIAAQEADKVALDKSTIAKNYQDIATARANMPGTTPITSLPEVSITAGNIPDSVAQTKFLQAIPDTNLQALIKGIADYTINPSSVPTRNYKGVGGMTQSQVLSMVSQYDPTFSQSQYASRQALRTNFTSGKYSQNINSLNTAVGHISDILSNIKSVGNNNGILAPLNAGKNAIASFFGSGAPGKASLNINAATSELATTFKGSGATDDEIKALGSIDANSSPDQVNNYIETATQLLASRLQALTDTYTAGMGKAPATPFLSPTSQAALQKLSATGLNIQVPGVNNSSATPSVGQSVSDASGVAEGTTAQGSDGKNYVAQGGQWVAQ